MLRILHSIPDECPDCGAPEYSPEGRVLIEQEEDGNTVACRVCGSIMLLFDECDRVEVSASFAKCPHCNSVNEIDTREGQEWCSSCGLDPNKTDYTAKELAHLWKEDSGIRKFMEKGMPFCFQSNMFRFLTQECGPHCNLNVDCPQEIANFSLCYGEDFVNGAGGRQLGKIKKKRLCRAEKRRLCKEKARAVLQCASSGWYERKLKNRNDTQNSQQSLHTGSGSGT